MDTVTQSDPADHDLLDDFYKDLRLVRNQVDELQLAAAERKRPWWRKSSTLISVIGVILSGVLGGVASEQQKVQIKAADTERHADEKKQQLDAINSSLAEIINIRTEDTKQQATLATTNTAAYNAWNSTINMRRLLLLQGVLQTADQFPGDVTPIAYLTIGSELLSDARYREAEHYIKEGVEVAQKHPEQTPFLQGALAQVYIMPGSPLFDKALARTKYQAAINYYSGCDFNSLNAHVRAAVYWATQEYQYGATDQSVSLMQRARRSVAQCSAMPKAGQKTLLNIVDGAELQTSKSNAYDQSHWLGDWTMLVIPVGSGTINVASMQNGPPVFSKEEFLNHILMQRQVGNVLVLTKNTIRLEWTGSFVMGKNGVVSQVGYSVVKLENDGSLSGNDYYFGLPPTHWTAHRRS